MSKKRSRGAAALVTLGLASLAAPHAAAEEVIAVTADNTLITFDTSTPGGINSQRVITGVTGQVIAIDVRPADGTLYALTDDGRLWRLDRESAGATAVGGPMAIAPSGDVGMDFDPVTDRIRIVTDTDQNWRVNPNDGTVIDSDPGSAGPQPDGALFYAIGDDNVFANPNVNALAHSDFPDGKTTAFAIDTALDVLTRLGAADGTEDSRNAGRLNTIGSLGVNALDLNGFDISRASNRAYAVLTLSGEPSSRLFQISLFTGAASFVGNVGYAVPIRAMTLGPATPQTPTPRIDFIGLNGAGELVGFSSDSPNTIAHRVAVTGLEPGDSLVSVALRPANRRLYGLSVAGRLYVLNANTGAASAIRTAPFEVPLAGTRFGFDFNPQSDVIRITSDADQNMRVRPDTGAVVDSDDSTAGVQTDAELAYASGDPQGMPDPNVVAVAYDRNGVRSVPTLFAIDSTLDFLARVGSRGGSQQSPNTGQLHTIGALGVDATDVVGFEIAGDANALATIVGPSGGSRLFSIDLDTGRATLVGDVGPVPETLLAVAVAPSSNPTPGDDLRVSHMIVKFDYRRESRDWIKVHGTIPFPAQPIEGTSVVVDVGGFSQSFVLDAKGRARDREDTGPAKDDDTFRLVGSPTDGRIRFETFLRREDVSDELSDEGMGGAETVRRESRTVRVTVTVAGNVHETDVTLRYSARAGKNGIAIEP
jgi:hypothetical protein